MLLVVVCPGIRTHVYLTMKAWNIMKPRGAEVKYRCCCCCVAGVSGRFFAEAHDVDRLRFFFFFLVAHPLLSS